MHKSTQRGIPLVNFLRSLITQSFQVVIQLLSRIQLFATPWTAALQASLSFTVSWVCPNSHPLSWWYHPTISSSVSPFSSCPQLFPESGSFPKIWLFTFGDQGIGSFSFSISPSNEYSGLISFRIDWFDLLAVQGTLKCLLQPHSLKATILWHSAFFMVQLSHPYMTVGKIIFLIMWTFVGKMTTLCFKTVTRFVIAFLPKSKRLLISWLQSLSHVVGH